MSKIVICSIIDLCKMFYLPTYGQLEVNKLFQFHSSMFRWVLYTAKCAGNSIFYNPYLKIHTKSVFLKQVIKWFLDFFFHKFQFTKSNIVKNI